MGLYDREYGRDGDGNAPGIRLDGPLPLTTKLVLITAGVYVLQLVIEGFTEQLLLTSDWFKRPWQSYRLLTYGFLHDTAALNHLLINMLVFWMFGRELERKYGQREFLWFYLTAIVLAGVGWSLCEAVAGTSASVVGASGGTSAVLALFALNFPHRKVLFMFFIPMPMWVAAVIGMLYDINLAMDRTGGIAGSAHLVGALFGLCYYRFGFSPGLWLANRFSGMKPRNKPKLRVHDPEEEDVSQTDQRVDEILKKIQAQGQESLTRGERRILEKASQEYQKKRR